MAASPVLPAANVAVVSNTAVTKGVKVPLPLSIHQGPLKPWTLQNCLPAAGFPSFLESIQRSTQAEKGRSPIVIACHNVNGIRAAVEKKSLAAWLSAESADVVALQEIKCSPEHLAEDKVAAALRDFTVFANCSTKKLGYAGTLLAVRKGASEDLRVCGVGYDLGVDDLDGHGRLVTLEFPRFYVVCVYVPNSGRPEGGAHPVLAKRAGVWDPAFREYLEALRLGRRTGSRSSPLAASAGGGDKGPGAARPRKVASSVAAVSAVPEPGPLSGTAKPVLVVGDFNVAYNDLDVVGLNAVFVL